MRRIPQMSYAEQFALDVFLTQFPSDAHFVTVVDMVSQGASEVSIHQKFDFLSREVVAQRIEQLATDTLKFSAD